MNSKMNNILSKITNEQLSSSFENSYSSESEADREEFIRRAQKIRMQFNNPECEEKSFEKAHKPDILISNDPQFLMDSSQKFYHNGKEICDIPEFMNGVPDFAQVIASNSR